ncbi:ABC transporter substrate-binding protein [Phormidium tenue FACHB-886]|nr:ABC transporter substrate-binding protein [Phormidium tenue FACHB-886]
MFRRYFLSLSAAACFATLTTNCSPRSQQQQSEASGLDLKTVTWDKVLELSKGTTVNFAMWGGSDSTNKFIDQWVANRLKQQYSITLNRVPLNDTVEAVNKIVGEVQAGLTKDGSIDLIWINGENFRTMKQGNLLLGPFTNKLPSLQFYDQNNAAVTSDFGLPNEGYESPYTGSYYVMAVDTAKVKQLPTNYQELLEWAKANPGRFGYVAPPAFDGSRFLLTTLYAMTGGYEQYAGSEFKEDLWTQNSPQVFSYLKTLSPYLWRQGQTYPPTQARLSELFANGEIWMMPVFVSQVAEGLATQQFPSTTKAFTIAGASLNDPSFTAIPSNAKNPSGAMVLADILASPEGQLEKFKPNVWGDPPLIDVQKLSPELQQQFAAVETQYGIPLKELIANTVPVVNAEYTTRLEQEWQQQIV